MKLFLMLLILATFQVQAQTSPVFTSNGAAIHGYDPVSFFKNGQPLKGDSAISVQWQGATWWFANLENKRSFEAKPEMYAPQYGGYCAYGASEGHKAPTQIDTWTIVDNKLYFNYSQKVKTFWNKDIPGHIKKADSNWPVIKNKE
jgi:YHS domain-containing protein